MTAIKFSDDLVGEVCGHIALGKSLRQIEKLNGMPSTSAIIKWLAQGDAYIAAGEVENPKAKFVAQYARAREAQADYLADEILDIADDSQYDLTTDENGREIVNTNHIQRDRLRVDSRRWLAGKLKPKKYGDKQQVEQSGPDGGPIETVNTINLNFVKP
jgi:hypothetical protein